MDIPKVIILGIFAVLIKGIDDAEGPFHEGADHVYLETSGTDNGTESTSRAVDEWAHRNGVKLDFIRPVKPVENAYMESFNGTLRQKCLEENWFTSLEDAKMKIACVEEVVYRMGISMVSKCASSRRRC